MREARVRSLTVVKYKRERRAEAQHESVNLLSAERAVDQRRGVSVAFEAERVGGGGLQARIGAEQGDRLRVRREGDARRAGGKAPSQRLDQLAEAQRQRR